MLVHTFTIGGETVEKISQMTTDNIYQVITALVVFFGAMGTLYNLAKSARRDTVDDLHRMVDRLQKQVDAQDLKLTENENETAKMVGKITDLEQENRLLNDWVKRLIGQLVDAGITPVSSLRTYE